MDLGRWMEAHQSEGKLIIGDRVALVNSAIKRWSSQGGRCPYALGTG